LGVLVFRECRLADGVSNSWVESKTLIAILAEPSEDKYSAHRPFSLWCLGNNAQRRMCVFAAPPLVGAHALEIVQADRVVIVAMWDLTFLLLAVHGFAAGVLVQFHLGPRLDRTGERHGP